MAERSSRPFYGEYAWAFDLLIDRPVGRDCAAITTWLSERGVLPGATILDAGCGTGRYAGELARRGYAVEGVDRSSELIETARQSVRSLSAAVLVRLSTSVHTIPRFTLERRIDWSPWLSCPTCQLPLL